MDGTTLEKLKVVFEAQYAGYKKDMEQVKNATKQVRKEVEAETSKINRQMSGVSTAHARREIDRLQTQLMGQREAIAAQEAIVRDLNNQYQSMAASLAKHSGNSGLESQLSAAEAELAELETVLQRLYAYQTGAQDFSAERGFNLSGMDAVRARIDELLPRYDEMADRVASLRQQMAELEPPDDGSASQLRQQIALAAEQLERLKATAADTEQQIERVMQSGTKGNLKEKINGIIDKMRQLGSSSAGSSRQMHNGFDKVSTGLTRLKQRLTGLAGSVLVFGVLSKGLSSGRDALAELLKTDEQFNSSLTATQNNLKEAFTPIYETVLPGINALMERLAALSQYLAVFMSNLFGTSRKAAKGIDTVTDAVKGYGSASGDLGLASFDHLNNLTTSPSGGVESGMPEDVINEDAVSAAEEFKDFLKELADDTAAFRRALKRLWDDGLSKLGNFSWQGLKDFYHDFLKPLGKWGFGTEGKGLTRLVDIFNEDLSRVPWDEINDNFSDFWQAVEPYAENFGEGLIDFLEDVGDIGTDALIKLFGDGGPLTKLTKWLNNHNPESARNWGYGLGVLAGSIAAFTTASKIANAITKANEFLGVIGGLKGLGKIAIVVTVAYEGFEIGKEIGKLLNPEDVDFYENFKWTGADGFFSEISRDWSSSFDGLTRMATDFENNPAIALLTQAVAGPVPTIVGNFKDAKSQLSELQEYFTEAGTFLENEWDRLWDGAGIKFQEWKEDNANKLREKKEEFDTWVGGLKESVEGFSEKVKDCIPTAFKTAFKNAVNGAAELLNKLIDWINEKLHLKWDALEIAGKEIIPAIDIQLFSLPKIPALARGGIVSQSTIAQIGEAGREAVLPLEHNTGWMNELATVIIRAFQEAVAASGDSGAREVNVYLQGDAAKFFTAMVEQDRKYYRRTGHSRFVH